MSNAQNGARIKVFGGSNDTHSVSGGGSGYVKNVTFQDFTNISESTRLDSRHIEWKRRWFILFEFDGLQGRGLTRGHVDVDNPIYLTQCYSSSTQQCQQFPATRKWIALAPYHRLAGFDCPFNRDSPLFELFALISTLPHTSLPTCYPAPCHSPAPAIRSLPTILSAPPSPIRSSPTPLPVLASISPPHPADPSQSKSPKSTTTTSPAPPPATSPTGPSRPSSVPPNATTSQPPAPT
jgi:hypothetical protein